MQGFVGTADGPDMTAPRLTLPNSYYFITRRTSQRQFLLLPKAVFNNAVRYCLALAAKKHGIKLIWSSWMSNHYHLGIFDPHGNVSKFLADLNRCVSKHHNSLLGRFENFWDNSKPSIIRVETYDDLMDKMAYSLANPSAADLVETAANWPGEISKPDDLLKTQSIVRPDNYFRDAGTCPTHVDLTYEKPDCAAHLSDQQYRAEVARRLELLESTHRARRDSELQLKRTNRKLSKKKGNNKRIPKRVLGLDALLRLRPTDTPSSIAKRFGLNPRIAAKNKWLRIDALARLKLFYAEYKAAREAWCAGDRNVIFPPGTYWMRIHHGCRCADPPASCYAA